MNKTDLYNSYFDPQISEKPYRNSEEHLKELFSLLDMCLAAVMSARGIEVAGVFEAGGAGYLPDISVAAEDPGGLLQPRQGADRAEGLLQEVTGQIGLGRSHIRSRLRKSADNEMLPRFEMLKVKFDLDDFESFALLLALAPQYDRKYEGVFSRLHNNTTDFYATKWLAIRLYESLFLEEAISRSRVLTGESPLCRFLCSRELRSRDRSEASGRLVLSARVTSFLLGKNDLSPILKEYCSLAYYDSKSYIPFREDIQEKLLYLILNRAFRDEGCFVAELYGDSGCGRTTMVCRAASSLGLNVLRIRLSPMIMRDDSKKLIDMIYTETILLGALPCFVIDTREDVQQQEDEYVPVQDERAMYSGAAAQIAGLFRFVFWLTPRKDSSFVSTDAQLISIEIPMLTANERHMFWKERIRSTDIDLMSCANRYILTPKGIRDSASLAELMAASDGTKLQEQHIVKAVRQYSVNQLGSYATRINAVFSWDDLVVDEEQKRRMKMICDQVRYRSIVNEDWGFSKGTPYGRGLCAMFYGSPGTGKTMAVQVMANELGLELYRIDLSQLTSKYIGETQKNINRLFDKAKNINAMLFFDEADAMFAKRSEVKDANDRYANADTAFLLQRLEDHEGITILATNYVNNIDDAFKRRIRFMVHFAFPEPDVRLKLWNRILPKDCRIDEPLDLEFFARRFELSGSNIKEILTNAAYLAAAEGTGLKNRHITEAVILNYSKYGKKLTKADFDYLGR